MKCDTCIFSRVVVSENGFHSICCLPDAKVKGCLIHGKYYVQHPKFRGAIFDDPTVITDNEDGET